MVNENFGLKLFDVETGTSIHPNSHMRPLASFLFRSRDDCCITSDLGQVYWLKHLVSLVIKRKAELSEFLSFYLLNESVETHVK